MPLADRPRRPLRLETLEERLALSWGSVPPSTIIPPTSPTAVILNSAAGAGGQAAITNDEIDYFTFIATRTGAYRFDASTPSSSLDTVLALFSATGTRLGYNDDIDATNTDSRTTVNLTAGQRYFLGITNYTGSANGSYRWQIAGPAGAVDDAYEDNDSFAAAYNLGTITTQRTVNNLVMADSQDWYKFNVGGAPAAGSAVSIAFTHAQGDLDLRLYDSTGVLVRTSDTATNAESVSLAGLTAGTYYVQVYGYQGARNPSYSMVVGLNGVTGATGGRVLYLNFDGATIPRASLTRWAGSDWAGMVNEFDADGNGITVQRFLAARSDRERVITRLMQLVQEDLVPYGVEVRRTTSLAVENQGATTIFLGQSTLTNGYVHVACDVDIGNNNRTDIAFVGDEDWGTADNTALALADVTLHEAGHTYGLWHVNSGTAPESMGLRYSVTDQTQWLQNTSFMDRTFPAFVSGGFAHGPGPLNTHRTMLGAFSGGGGGGGGGSVPAPPGGFPPAAPPAGAPPAGSPVGGVPLTGGKVGVGPAGLIPALIDTSRPGVLAITLSPDQADTLTARRLATGSLEVVVNGKIFEVGPETREIRVYTSGDARDVVRPLGSLAGVAFTVRQQAGADLLDVTKVSAQNQPLWSGAALTSVGSGCGCAICNTAARRSTGAVAVDSTPAAGGAILPPATLSDAQLTMLDAVMAQLAAQRRDRGQLPLLA